MESIIRNCKNCEHLSSDGDGPEYNGSWPICSLDYEKNPRTGEEYETDNSSKPNFPMETEQPCHEPGFWQYCSLDDELGASMDKEAEQGVDNGFAFPKTMDLFQAKYPNMSCFTCGFTSEDCEHKGKAKEGFCMFWREINTGAKGSGAISVQQAANRLAQQQRTNNG